MRILIIHNHYKQTGGEDTVFFAEANLLEEHGNIVDKLTFSNNSVNSLADKLHAALGTLYNFKSANIVEEKLRQFKPDVVHVHNFFPLVSPAVFYVCKRHRIPVIMTLHNYRLICPSAYLHYKGKVHMENATQTFPYAAVLDGAYRNSRFHTASVVLTTGLHKLLNTWRSKVDYFITLTAGAAKLFQQSSLRPHPEQLLIKPNFTADLGMGAADREDYFLFVGRLSPEKGVETMLKAHAKHRFKLKVIGDGPLREMVEAHAQQHSDLEYLGYQKHDRVKQELQAAKALLFPSEWPEMFGMSIIEAFSTGTPVIAAKIGGGEHLVHHNYNGLHYTPEQESELAAQLSQLQQNVDLARQLGQNARQSYERLYTPEANYQMLVQIYEEAINQKKNPASATVVAKAGFQ
ncbi:glycosyltransferase family 4 protein [Pontibacter locisalis]|uniref:Glycosyltransferase family 4 protein n=1 Tax=Pontibacter locisalis TaxID=1719035 RepID=A0ABW5IP05_9BACT